MAWQQPKDHSPFPTPGSWKGGGVEAIGGGGQARIWYNDGYRVIYEQFNNKVDLQDPDGRLIDQIRAYDNTDAAKQRVAQTLMQRNLHPPFEERELGDFDFR